MSTNGPENCVYRLRNKATGEYLNNILSRKPNFTSLGKTFKHKSKAKTMLIDYALMRELEGGDWPDIELITFSLVIDEIQQDNTPDFVHLARFINETQGGSWWGPVAKEAKRLTLKGVDFTYLILAYGEHDLRAIKSVHVRHSRGEMVVALPDSDRDLIYVKMALAHELIGIWNFKTCQKI